MRKVLWMLLFFGAYVWVMTSGHDRFLFEQGKSAFQALVSWFDDAEVDFQVKHKKLAKDKKRHRRWE